jgi:hypothetical protein
VAVSESHLVVNEDLNVQADQISIQEESTQRTNLHRHVIVMFQNALNTRVASVFDIQKNGSNHHPNIKAIGISSSTLAKNCYKYVLKPHQDGTPKRLDEILHYGTWV